jgi:hypothetical protein
MLRLILLLQNISFFDKFNQMEVAEFVPVLELGLVSLLHIPDWFGYMGSGAFSPAISCRSKEILGVYMLRCEASVICMYCIVISVYFVLCLFEGLS